MSCFQFRPQPTRISERGAIGAIGGVGQMQRNLGTWGKFLVHNLSSRTVPAMATLSATASLTLSSKSFANAFPPRKSWTECFIQSAARRGESGKLAAAAGVAMTMALTGMPKSPLLTSGRPSMAVASLGQAGPAAGFASQFVKKDEDNGELPQTVVSPQWLKNALSNSNIKVVDASWYMPNEKRDTLEEYKEEHIPGAVFFDIEKISDVTSDMPHMLPSEAAFEQAVSALGIRNQSWVVVYDTKGIFSAARVWWMFRAFGHDKVWVLDGGLPNWKANNYPVESDGTQVQSGQEAVSAVHKVYSGEKVPQSQYKATLQPDLVWSVKQVKDNLEKKQSQVIDARGRARFDGTAPEPRQGVRGGHIPDSKCVPFTEVLSQSGTLLATEELGSKFGNAGVATEGPIVASCGTGVTACILALALHRLGKFNVAVYDGSWTEWGSLPDTPVEITAPTISA